MENMPVVPTWWLLLFKSIYHVFKTSALSQTLISQTCQTSCILRESHLTVPRKFEWDMWDVCPSFTSFNYAMFGSEKATIQNPTHFPSLRLASLVAHPLLATAITKTFQFSYTHGRVEYPDHQIDQSRRLMVRIWASLGWIVHVDQYFSSFWAFLWAFLWHQGRGILEWLTTLYIGLNRKDWVSLWESKSSVD